MQIPAHDIEKSLAALRKEAAVLFVASPEPSFKYGLNIFFAPGSINLPETVAPENRMASGTAVLGAVTGVEDGASSHLSGPGNHPVFPTHSSHGDSSVRRFGVVAPAEVSVMTLAGALADERFAAIILSRLSFADADRIDHWNLASLAEGLFVHVPAGVRASSPVRVDLRLSDSFRADCTVVLAEMGSVVTVVEHLASEGADAKLRASRTEIVAREGATVTHVSVQDFANDVTSFDRRRADVAAGASVSWTDCAFGGGYVRSRVSTDLSGEHASARVMGMSFAGASQRHDIRHEVAHLASRTESDLRSRVGLDGEAKTVYRSLVRVAPGTTGCIGMQKEDTLLLSPDVEIDAMPDLEIGTGEVRARHSASAGKLDRERLFYLMSRGLSEQVASKTLVDAFFAPIVADMRGSGLEDMVECLVAARLERTPTL